MILSEIFGPKPGTVAHQIERTMMTVMNSVPENAGFVIGGSGRESYDGYTVWNFSISTRGSSALNKLVDPENEEMLKSLGAKAEKLQLKIIKTAQQFVLDLIDEVENISISRTRSVEVRYINEDGLEISNPEINDIKVPGRFGLRCNVDHNPFG